MRSRGRSSPKSCFEETFEKDGTVLTITAYEGQINVYYRTENLNDGYYPEYAYEYGRVFIPKWNEIGKTWAQKVRDEIKRVIENVSLEKSGRRARRDAFEESQNRSTNVAKSVCDSLGRDWVKAVNKEEASNGR